MGDSVFHIVEKSDGEIEIVQLVQRFNCSNAKIKKKSKLPKEVINSECKKIKKTQETPYIKKDNCNCVMCQPILQDCPEKSPTKLGDENKELQECPEKSPTKLGDENKEKLTKICVRKNYSRSKIKNDNKKKEANVAINNKSMYISCPCQNIEKDKAITSSITIKNEPEIEIMDLQDETELAIEKETINLQETSTFTEKGEVKRQVEKISKLQEVVTSDSTKKQPKSSIESGTNNTLFELTTKNLQCNVCGMEFSKSYNQLQILKTHFLQHKTSSKRVIKKYTGVKYITDKSESVESVESVERFERFEESPIQKPLILNKDVKRKGDLQNALQLKKNSLLVSDVVPKLKTSSPRIIGKTKFINLKKVPLSSLRNADFVIGNTTIKNLKRTSNKSTKRDQTFAVGYVKQRCKAVDSDDDIEIVEQKPELIVIDDNDDDDKPKCNSQID